MTDEETIEKMMKLRLGTMAKTFRELLADSPGNQLSFGERVGLLVDREWIQYDEVVKSRVSVARGGRGARGTKAVAHDAVEVVAGRTFVTIIDIPAWREDWSDRE